MEDFVRKEDFKPSISTLRKHLKYCTANKEIAPDKEIYEYICQSSHSTHHVRQIEESIFWIFSAPSKQWRAIQNSLEIMKYLLINGSQLICANIRERYTALMQMSGFMHSDGRQVYGGEVRQLVSLITWLLDYPEGLQEARKEYFRKENEVNPRYTPPKMDLFSGLQIRSRTEQQELPQADPINRPEPMPTSQTKDPFLNKEPDIFTSQAKQNYLAEQSTPGKIPDIFAIQSDNINQVNTLIPIASVQKTIEPTPKETEIAPNNNINNDFMAFIHEFKVPSPEEIPKSSQELSDSDFHIKPQPKSKKEDPFAMLEKEDTSTRLDAPSLVGEKPAERVKNVEQLLALDDLSASLSQSKKLSHF